MAEEVRAFGYICPACGKPVYGTRTLFALNAAVAGIVCDCGHSELTAEPVGKQFRVTTPCGVCGGEHRAEVPAGKFLHGKGAGLACPQTKQLCCYIGEPESVSAALRELAIAVEKRKERKEDAFVDNIIMYEVLSELKDMVERGSIRCTCGHTGCSLSVHSGSVDLICPQCGGRLRIPAATDEDLDRLCCQIHLTIRGNKQGNKQ